MKSEMWDGVVVGEAYEQVAYLNYDRMQVFLAPAEQFEILGHPITLEHVLKVYELKWTPETDMERYNKEEIRTIREWTFGKPLSEQSPETIEWLNKIIV